MVDHNKVAAPGLAVLPLACLPAGGYNWCDGVMGHA